MRTMPQIGRVVWIGVRPEKFVSLEVLTQVSVDPDEGLVGDRYSKRQGKRQVTLIQQEHLEVVASILKRERIDPGDVRRNIVVTGINLLALKEQRFEIGGAVLEFTGLCHPCSRMEQVLGPGGYNAMRGHGGINARVVVGGVISVHDGVRRIAGNKAE